MVDLQVEMHGSLEDELSRFHAREPRLYLGSFTNHIRPDA